MLQMNHLGQIREFSFKTSQNSQTTSASSSPLSNHVSTSNHSVDDNVPKKGRIFKVSSKFYEIHETILKLDLCCLALHTETHEIDYKCWYRLIAIFFLWNMMWKACIMPSPQFLLHLHLGGFMLACRKNKCHYIRLASTYLNSEYYSYYIYCTIIDKHQNK